MDACLKLRELVRQRAWALAVALGVSVLLWRRGELSAQGLAAATGIAVGVSLGRMPLKQGLKAVMGVWMQDGHGFAPDRLPRPGEKWSYGEGVVIQ